MATILNPNVAVDVLCPCAFGHFTKGGRSFLITDPNTPMPWTNVFGNENYGVVISQSGSGFSWFENCQLSRVTRWEQDLALDRQGRFVYLQDADDTNKIWSTTLQPTLQEADLDQIEHGLGYTTYTREIHGIRSEQTVFVPQEDSCEVWLVKLTNKTKTTRNIRVAGYIEWFVGGVSDWHREFHRLFIETREKNGKLIAFKHPGLRENYRVIDDVAWVAAHGLHGVEVDGWSSNKAEFVGRPGRTDRPAALVEGNFRGGNHRWEDPIASLTGLVKLRPGETITLSFVLGVGKTESDATGLIDRYTVERAQSELARVERYWTDFCERTTVDTGNSAVDVMTNYWLKYQAYAGRMVVRCAYYQQGGAYGFRDQLQDSLALLSIQPERTLQQLLLHAEATYEDGGVRHWWHPGTNIFASSHHSDTCLWFPFGLLAYLDETNNLEILDVRARFLSRETQDFASDGTLLEHVLRGVRRTLGLLSERGLPLIQAGDWNDGLSHAGIDGKGESVWVGMFLYGILTRWIPILKDTGHDDLVAEFTAAAEAMKIAVNAYGWDGDWYLEGVCDDGQLLGGHQNTFGKIFLNPQTWAVLTGIAPEDRATHAMDEVNTRLVKDYGALLLAPAFSKVDPYVGYITRYAPGSRENGGVYSHASAWAVQAFAQLGRSKEAESVFLSMIPCNGRDAEHYSAEPYVMPGNIDGPDSPNEGRAGWTWYTGSAAWLYRMSLDWVIGVRATREGLLIAPPAKGLSQNVRIKRLFRNDTFDIRITGSGSNVSILCDTATVRGNVLESTESGRVHDVTVQLS